MQAARIGRMKEAAWTPHGVTVLDKLGVRDRAHAVIWAYEHGLVEPGV